MFAFVQKYRTFNFIAAYVLMFGMLAALGGYVMQNARIGTPSHLKGFSDAENVELAYYDLPRMTVAVDSSHLAGPRVRMDVALEVSRKDIRVIDGYQPRIVDRLTAFLSNLSLEDIERPGSLPWLRSQMLEQVNSAGSPVTVRDLMFRQLVVM